MNMKHLKGFYNLNEGKAGKAGKPIYGYNLEGYPVDMNGTICDKDDLNRAVFESVNMVEMPMMINYDTKVETHKAKLSGNNIRVAAKGVDYNLGNDEIVFHKLLHIGYYQWSFQNLDEIYSVKDEIIRRISKHVYAYNLEGYPVDMNGTVCAKDNSNRATFRKADNVEMPAIDYKSGETFNKINITGSNIAKVARGIGVNINRIKRGETLKVPNLIHAGYYQWSYENIDRLYDISSIIKNHKQFQQVDADTVLM